jgi:hypothetical protein
MATPALLGTFLGPHTHIKSRLTSFCESLGHGAAPGPFWRAEPACPTHAVYRLPRARILPELTVTSIKTLEVPDWVIDKRVESFSKLFFWEQVRQLAARAPGASWRGGRSRRPGAGRRTGERRRTE